MSFGTIKIDKADKVFSQYVRLRDGECRRCHSLVNIDSVTGLPVSHQISHYFGRGKESVRFDEMNADCLCGACHSYWEKEDREAYRDFKVKQLGQKKFDLLRMSAEILQKKDRKMAYLYWKKRLEEILWHHTQGIYYKSIKKRNRI